ncbi:Uncharacterised protein [Candidatus Anstonella stagnisolia]|nr:Uncharacterised protein [Candidatus Anstonella stagnisolia]
MSVEKEQQVQKPNVFEQMPMARADEKFAPAKEQPKQEQKPVLLGLKVKKVGELVFKPQDLKESTTAREVATKAIEGMKSIATASKHEQEFGTLGLKVKNIDELRVSKDGNSYSAKIGNGDSYLTLRLGENSTTLALSGRDGALRAYAEQKKDAITFEQQSA